MSSKIKSLEHILLTFLEKVPNIIYKMYSQLTCSLCCHIIIYSLLNHLRLDDSLHTNAAAMGGCMCSMQHPQEPWFTTEHCSVTQ